MHYSAITVRTFVAGSHRDGNVFPMGSRVCVFLSRQDLGDGAPGSFSGITNGGAKAKAPKQPKAPRPMKHARQPKNGQKPEAVEEPGAAATGCHAPEESAGGEGLKRKRDECGDAEPVAQVRRHADALPQGA